MYLLYDRELFGKYTTAVLQQNIVNRYNTSTKKEVQQK